MPSPRARVALALLAAALASGPSRAAPATSLAPSPPAPEPETFVVTLDREGVVEGIKLPAGSQLVFEAGAQPAPLKGPDGRPAPFYGPAAPVLHHVVPSRELTAWGLPISAEEQLFLGSFVSLVVARESSLEGFPLEEGTIVEFERRRGAGEDQPAAIKVLRGFTLGRAATVRGVQFPGSTALEFLADGTLWRARLFDDEELLDFPVSASADAEFHPSGKLAAFRLSRDFQVDGYVCLAEADVRLHPSGALASCYVAEGQSVQGFVADRTRPATFDADGRVRNLTLGSPALVDGLQLPAGVVIDFHPNGRIKRLRPGASGEGALLVRGIPVVPLPGRDDAGASFRPAGSLEAVVTGADFVHDGVPCLAGTTEFWLSGRIKSARLSREWQVGSRTYPPRAQVRFKRDGSPARD
jgi:hypothetical protein